MAFLSRTFISCGDATVKLAKWAFETTYEPCQHYDPNRPERPAHPYHVARASAWLKTRSARRWLVEIAGVVVVLVSVAAWSVPCAGLLGGLTLIVAIEARS